MLHAAYFLGMSHETPSSLMWIADFARAVRRPPQPLQIHAHMPGQRRLTYSCRAAAQAPLPLGWTQHEASRPGSCAPVAYFHNEALGVTTWEHPGYSQLRMLFRALHGPAREGGGAEEPSAAAFREQLQRALRREESGAA